jgi:hypothetical protein
MSSGGAGRPVRAAEEPSVGEAQRSRASPRSRRGCQRATLARFAYDNRPGAIRRRASDDEVAAPVATVTPREAGPDVPAVAPHAEPVRAPAEAPGPLQLEAWPFGPAAEDLAIATPELDVVVRRGGNRAPAEHGRPGNGCGIARRQQSELRRSVGGEGSKSEQRDDEYADHSCAPSAQTPLLLTTCRRKILGLGLRSVQSRSGAAESSSSPAISSRSTRPRIEYSLRRRR